ncbi:MAG TPA: hypothetical protein VFA53_10275 [Xanthobacteraceae bacterium]|nr:hypothetical protein [Xanthobacteraceae bacterium]
MIRLKSKISVPPDLSSLRAAHAALRREWETVKRELYARKFDSNQPRVPAGSPEGGQWTSGGTGNQTRDTDSIPSSATNEGIVRPFTRLAARRRSPALEAECEFQYRQDTFICNSLGSASCHEQATLRYANWLAGLPIPKLIFGDLR